MLPKVGDGVNGRFVRYRNLTLNHSLAPNNPLCERQRPGSAAGPCTGRGKAGKQEADSEELEGIPEKQTTASATELGPQ